jgi:hypothetical protein
VGYQGRMNIVQLFLNGEDKYMDIEMALLKALINKGFITNREYERALVILTKKISDST